MKDERERLESHPNLLRGNPATYFEGDRAREAQKKAMESLRKKNMERKLIKEQLIEKMGAQDWDEVIRGAIERAKVTDKGFEVLRDTLGEKPKEVVDVNGAPAVVILSGESEIRD